VDLGKSALNFAATDFVPNLNIGLAKREGDNEGSRRGRLHLGNCHGNHERDGLVGSVDIPRAAGGIRVLPVRWSVALTLEFKTASGVRGPIGYDQ
jgi:hypothetical protein